MARELRVFLHARQGQPHQHAAMSALATGLKKHGHETLVSDMHAGAEQADVVVWWGDRVPNYIRCPKLILEAGYINGASGDYVQDRLRFISVSWNKPHGLSDGFRREFAPGRWRALGIAMQPWVMRGGVILVVDQHPGDAASPDPGFWSDVVKRCRTLGDVVQRPHPLVRPSGPLAEDLARARLVVTYSSTAAVEAVLAGVPTVSLSGRSVAWPVTAHTIDGPLFLGDREPWAYTLAYRQWSLAELESGEAWGPIWREGCGTA